MEAMPGLIMRKGPLPGVRFPLAERLILGRHRKADVVVQDPSASRRHAAVISRGGNYRLLDLGSTNGTILNGQLIQGEAALEPGDLIQIGQEVFEFVLEDSASRIEPPTVSLLTVPLDRSTLKVLPAGGEKKNGKKERKEGGADAPGGELPRELGKYILLSHLGRGGMGDVYRARARDGELELAVKLIRSEIGNRGAFLDHFHNREAVLAREIDHPNVIKIYEHGAVGDQHFIAMEYVEGESLQDRLRRAPIPFDETLEILRQVACGLAAAHRRRVVHSDIKPANIMVVRAGSEARAAPVRNAPSRVVLEFPEIGSGPSASRYEGALQEEIRRRLGDPPQDMLLDPPYYPRNSEMRFLRHYWQSLRESGGHFVLVEGDGGAGKDRLLSEFVKELGLEGSVSGAFVPPPAKLYELDASRIEGIPQLYQRLFPDRAPLERPTREAVEEILRSIASLHAFPPRSPDGKRDAPREPAVVRVLSLSEASPLACELLRGLLRLLPAHPILVLSTLDVASLSQTSPVSQLLSTEGGRLKELYLRPLSRYQIGRYLEELFREPPRQDALADDLYRLTGGNFGRLLEAVRSFFQRGILKLDRPAGHVVYQPSPREIELEEGKQFYEKYRSYGKMEQRVLEHAAFIGPEFLFDTLLRFCEVDETALFFIVRDLFNQGFISEPSRTWYRFTNLAFQRYIAERVSARDRARLHRKVAWLLDEAPMAASPELLRLRASHWEGAGEHSKAVRLLLEGAHLSRTEYDFDLVRHMYQDILRIYRSLASDEQGRRGVTDELRDWFHREANWYEVLGNLGEDSVRVQVKITDFGISFKTQEEGFWIQEQVALGTPRYLSPERVQRQKGGPKSDIFSLGIIAHEMVTGSPPFPGKKGAEVMRSNLEREIPVPEVTGTAVPPEFYDLYRGMVEKDPDLRWDAERILRTISKMQFEARMGG
jgi:serine/threonine protein kinase